MLLNFSFAEPSGGLAMIKAVAAPYNKLRFMPTGGINAKMLYLTYNTTKSLRAVEADGKKRSYQRRKI